MEPHLHHHIYIIITLNSFRLLQKGGKQMVLNSDCKLSQMQLIITSYILLFPAKISHVSENKPK